MARRDRLIRQSLRERFIVTMASKATFDGLLLDVDDRTVRLTNSFALEGSSRIAVDGDLYLPRGEVAYMQKPNEVRG